MQFHPTTLAPTGVLITEGCRGEGAYLLNSDGERFLKRYAPNAMELASRDVISRAEQTEIDEGRGIDGNVLLDLRHLGAEKILERLHGTRELAMVFAASTRSTSRSRSGPAPTTTWAASTRTSGAARSRGPVRGGGVRVRLRARREQARRQRADGDDHLRQAGRAARGRGGARRRTTVTVPASAVRDAERELKELLDRSRRRAAVAIRDELGETMHENFGVFRREEQMLQEGRSSPACASATSTSSSTTRATCSTAT